MEALVCSDPGALSVMLGDWISSEVQGERRPVIPGVEEDCVCVCVLDPQPHPGGSSIGIKGCGGR